MDQQQAATATQKEPATRIYFVQGRDEFRLVEARSKRQAVDHVVGTTYAAAIADQKTLVLAIKDGVSIEQAA